jgi:hypothetical protein
MQKKQGFFGKFTRETGNAGAAGDAPILADFGSGRVPVPPVRAAPARVTGGRPVAEFATRPRKPLKSQGN